MGLLTRKGDLAPRGDPRLWLGGSVAPWRLPTKLSNYWRFGSDPGKNSQVQLGKKPNGRVFSYASCRSAISGSTRDALQAGRSDEDKFDHPTQKPVEQMRRPILNHLHRGRADRARLLRTGARSEICGCRGPTLAVVERQ